jgi:tetratricopeptide (TPR) repeat protein
MNHRRRRRTGSRGRCGVALALVLASLAGACAKRVAPTAPATPRFPDFEYPAVPAGGGAVASLVADHQGGWNLLQSGDAREAERVFAGLVRKSPDFYPGRTGLAYTELAQRDYDAALAAFDQALAQSPQYLPALVGRAEALVAANKAPEAVSALEAILKVDPNRATARTRLDSLRLGSIGQLVEAARRASQSGDLAAAREAWTRAVAASPDSAFMHRELALVEWQAGRLDEATTHATRTLELDDRDAATHALVGELRAARGDLDGAHTAFARAAELDPRDEYQRRLTGLEREIALAAMPVEFRAISSSPSVTRGDLAALLGTKLERWLESRGSGSPVLTDTRAHWAQRWILAVASAGLMEVYPNHTFQPGVIVRRSDLADVISRGLEFAASKNPGEADRWRSAKPSFQDLPPQHAAYPAAALAVGAGIMSASAENTFAPTRPVTGAEAMAAVERLEALLARP